MLLRDFAGDDSSDGSATTLIDVVASEPKVKITAMIVHAEACSAFCGKDDGCVSVYDLKTGNELRTLYRHKSLIRILTWWPQSSVLMSVDASNAIFAWDIEKGQKEGLVAKAEVFQARLDSGTSIIQLLPGEAAGKFVLSTRSSDHLWGREGKQRLVRDNSGKPGIRKWILHQQSPLHMICIEGASAHVYAWEDWSEVAVIPFVAGMLGMQLKSITPLISKMQPQILVEMSDLDGSTETRSLFLFDTSSLSMESCPTEDAGSIRTKQQGAAEDVSVPALERVTPSSRMTVAALTPLLGPQLAAIASRVAHVIGVHNTNQLVFLDTRSWVCSANINTLRQGQVSYSRHFFVPYDWFAGSREVVCALAQRDVIFVRHADIAVIRGGLEYMEEVDLEIHLTSGKRIQGA